MNNGTTAFITGASSGIGEAFARRLAADGFNLVLHGRRKARLAAICEDLRKLYGVRTDYVLAELSIAEDLHALEERVRRISDLALLINNAGYSSKLHFAEEPVDGQEAIIRTHVLATVRLTHAVLPGMFERRSGAIINVSSVAGFLNSPGAVTYCATKSYLINFSESLHLEVAHRGIRVQALCPGFTRSDFHARLGYDTGGEFFRNFMKAEDVVDASLRDLRKGKVVCIPGLRYKFAALAPRFLPRRLYYWIVLKFRGYRATLNESR